MRGKEFPQKKVLSLVLCVAVMLSVMVMGAGAAFSDQDKIENTEAVNMCTALNIIGGYPDGSYKPEGNIKRSEITKMICVALNGGKEPNVSTNTTPTFSDVRGTNAAWAEGYIESCVAQGIISGVGGVFTSSYLSEDADMLAADAAYCELEQELQYELNHYEALHPGYDEYRFDLDEIEHDPYVLISILTAFHEGVFTIDAVQAELQMLFEKQYILTQTVEVEVRYRTETRTDSEGNDYDVEVPYNYYICNVKLENFDLSHVPVYIMDEETLSLYAVYMATLGNREDLFPGSGYVDKYTKPPTTYDIPPSALEDETFAALITEAEKYIGYPYVWGGSNPNTSFDCSGFVSWVLTESGVCNTGRLGAQGLYNISTPVSSANARPGDLIFFVGTYDTPGVSHVGIYVGGGKMLHCGDPIQYADINTSYWQSHFYAFGRPPYN